jgi:hypothetical protein
MDGAHFNFMFKNKKGKRETMPNKKPQFFSSSPFTHVLSFPISNTHSHTPVPSTVIPRVSIFERRKKNGGNPHTTKSKNRIDRVVPKPIDSSSKQNDLVLDPVVRHSAVGQSSTNQSTTESSSSATSNTKSENHIDDRVVPTPIDSSSKRNDLVLDPVYRHPAVRHPTN